MGRKRRVNKHLPPNVYLNHGAYFLVKNNIWTRLGATKQDMYKALAEIFMDFLAQQFASRLQAERQKGVSLSDAPEDLREQSK